MTLPSPSTRLPQQREPQPAPLDPPPPADLAPPTERQERITLRARIGSAPRFKRTSTGKYKGEFALYTRVDDTDVRHSVYVFGDRAKRLADKQLKPGAVIEVVAYPHTRLLRRHDGASKEVIDLYATAVRTTLTPAP